MSTYFLSLPSRSNVNNNYSLLEKVVYGCCNQNEIKREALFA
jgi:hypothetical protein